MSQSIDMKIQLWPIAQIKPYELNSKIHDEKQVAGIAKSITEFGWDQPIVVDKDGVIIKGHGRREAALSLGLKQVPVLVRDDLTPEQVRAARLADNRVALGGIDSDLLAKELATLEYDLTGIFDEKELSFMEADLAAMNADAFAVDLGAEVAKQSAETMSKIDEVDKRRVPIAKALGFKDVSGADERSIVRFMAQVEAETGKQGGEAFIEFVNSLQEAA